MNEAFKKIIERLEEDYSQDVGALKMISVDKAIEIVKEVAEEYVTDINVGKNDGLNENTTTV